MSLPARRRSRDSQAAAIKGVGAHGTLLAAFDASIARRIEVASTQYARQGRFHPAFDHSDLSIFEVVRIDLRATNPKDRS